MTTNVKIENLGPGIVRVGGATLMQGEFAVQMVCSSGDVLVRELKGGDSGTMPKPQVATPTSPLGKPDANRLPAQFQIGDTVFVAGSVAGVTFREGFVSYEVAIGTTGGSVLSPTYIARPFDVVKRDPAA